MTASATAAARRDRTRDTAPVGIRALMLSLGGFLGAVLLNLHHTALWCLPVALAASAWRARVAHRTAQLPGRALRMAVVVTLTAAVLLGFRTLNGLAAGTSLLVAMAALKLSETRHARDWLIVIGAALFLLLAAGLDAPALWRLPFYAAELWLLCTALYALGAGEDGPPTAALLSTSARSLAAALPLAIVLFLFFPRLPGSFWALPVEEEAVTGLGDDMSPGSISRLSESDEPALRVRFDGALPPLPERYWRGPVLHDFDGYAWHRRHSEFAQQPQLDYAGPAYEYEVTLEPNTHNVLIALELPSGPPPSVPSAFTTFDYQLVTPQPITRALSYHLESYPLHRSLERLSVAARRLDLAFPPDRNPRSIELALRLRAGASQDAAYVDSALDYFRRGGFQYTLTPPRLDFNSIDDLLFNTRQGFCGHFASAFALLMRAGGVPARVVTGYLGGDWNRFGAYLLIRQSDAHAWVEVWLDGRGWVRVDPTAVVAPARLTNELDDLLPAAGGAGRRLRTAPWIGTAVQAWQAANAWWQDQFIGFNFAKQLNLIERLGLQDRDWNVLALLLAVGGALWLALAAWALRPRGRRVRDDDLARAWRSLERKLRHSAAPRAAYEGPMAYAERVSRSRPELAALLQPLARRYARLRYGPEGSALQLQQFRRAVRQFRPARGARPSDPTAPRGSAPAPAGSVKVN